MTRSGYEAVVIGASAGAVEALSIVLPTLPGNYALPVFIVVHQPPDKKSVIADLFKMKCRLVVKEAEDKEEIQGGTIYFAPPDYHLLVETDKTLSLSNEEPVLYSRPSIDILFESAADAYGPTLIGVILTGANTDGAEGLRAIVKKGGRALIQRPDLAYASAMPQASVNLCPYASILTLNQIADYLQSAAQ